MNPRKISVLLVEDLPDEVQLIENLLHQSNHSESSYPIVKLVQMENLNFARAYLQNNACDVVLLDLTLPDADGLDAFLEIKNRYPAIPIIILCDQASRKLAKKAVKYGAQDYLSKANLTPRLLKKSVLNTIERHRALVEVRGRAAALESQNLELNDFAHTVAHQIQGLLSQMVGYASLVDSHYQEQLSNPAQQAVDQIMQSGYKMNNVITELLFLASMRSEDVQVNVIDNQRILKEVFKRLRYQIRETGAKITIPQTWPQARGYAPWIEEVWLNYLSNGLKYGSKDDQPPVLRLGAEKNGNGMVRFWVSDNGPGISEVNQKRLFRPHTRVTSKNIRGEGLGLSIVWRIIKKCGGNVGVESKEGTGSCFWFTLPEYDISLS